MSSNHQIKEILISHIEDMIIAFESRIRLHEKNMASHGQQEPLVIGPQHSCPLSILEQAEIKKVKAESIIHECQQNIEKLKLIKFSVYSTELHRLLYWFQNFESHAIERLKASLELARLGE